jgi:hypothetical protein
MSEMGKGNSQRFVSNALSIMGALFLFVGVFKISISKADSEPVIIDESAPQVIQDEIIADWKTKDNAENSYASAIANIKTGFADNDAYKSKIVDGVDEAAYINACHWRRVSRIKPWSEQLYKILYARHHDIGGSIIGFTEELPNDTFTSKIGKWGSQYSISRWDYVTGGALLQLTMNNYYPRPIVLFEDKKGFVRDPCVSFDGKKVVFAWNPDPDRGGYHIYEMEINNPQKPPVQLTSDPCGLAVSDFEPCYLPNGDILFNSSRCFGYVDCNFNITSNFYLMNKEGKYLRRICFDQLHNFYPSVMSDGSILYSRWEYNDRNIANCFGLFIMNTDGSHQREYFGNQTSWPATLPQAREIPGANGKVLAITGGHIGPYAGDLMIIDPSKKRNGVEAVQLVAPLRQSPKPKDVDFLYGVPDSTKLFQNPFPLNKDWFLISYRVNRSSKFRIYLMNINGDRELLAWDDQSVSQQQSCIPRTTPPVIAYQADYSKSTGRVTMANAYFGSGTGENVASGSIAKIRIIALEYHTDPSFGNTGSSGFTMTPVGRWTASWMSKSIVGEARVEEDGSADFYVPSRTPLYFQLIDRNGCAINSMRSWLTVMPGEQFSCIGCHEDKNVAPGSYSNRMAKAPQDLDSFYGIKNDYLYYPKHIQPILDSNCISCHKRTKASGGLDLSGTKIWTGTLKNDPNNNNACRYWCKSYYNLTNPDSNYVNFIDVNSPAEGLPPNSVGSVASRLIKKLRNPSAGMNVNLSKKDMAYICAWIDLSIPHSGRYTDDMQHDDSLKYLSRLSRRQKMEMIENSNINDFVNAGQYQSYHDVSFNAQSNKNFKNSLKKQDFSVRFSSSGHGIFVKTMYDGKLTLTDLSGRVIKIFQINSIVSRQNSGIFFRTNLSKGIYIANYSGTRSTEHHMFAVFN